MIAGGVDRLSHARDLLQADGVLPQRLRGPDPADLRVREVEHRRPGDDAVEVLREALGRHQSLTPAGRAAEPVVVLRRPAVMLGDELLDRDRGQVHGAVGVVDLPVAVVVGEARQRIAGRVVAGIRRRGDVALIAQRVGAPLDRLLAGVASAAAHDEPSVPVRGQAGAEADVGSDHGVDPAVLRLGVGVHDLGIHDADVEVRARDEVDAHSPRPRRRRLPLQTADAERRDDQRQTDARMHAARFRERGGAGYCAATAAPPPSARQPGARPGCPPSSSCLRGRRTRKAGSRSAASASKPSSRSPTCRDR